MERLSRSWQDPDKITIVFYGSYEGYRVNNSTVRFFETYYVTEVDLH